jgi:hypothetical protein
MCLLDGKSAGMSSSAILDRIFINRKIMSRQNSLVVVHRDLHRFIGGGACKILALNIRRFTRIAIAFIATLLSLGLFY